jgi:hypothetical protein
MFIFLRTLFFSLIFTQICIAQSDKLENFNPKFTQTDTGGKVVFCCNSKKIEVNLFGKKIENVETKSFDGLSNSYFVAVDKIITQTTLITIPESVQKVYGIENLTLDQQLKILKGYMSYEIDYLNDSEGPGAKDINYAEGNVGNQKHLIWNYFYKDYHEESDENGEAALGQFCASTLVFNQVLTVSIVVTKSNSNINPVLLLKKIMENIEIQKKECD